MEADFIKENIPGWGYDLKPEDRPAYPMWHKVENTGSHYTEQTMPMQRGRRELLSIEHPEMTPAWGDTVPASGLSGLIRKFAFRYSEGSFGHWLPLLFADRVNMVEGILDDFLHLRIPNVWKEMGLKSEWKYNRKSLVQKTVVTTAVLTGVVGIFLMLSNKNENSTTRSTHS